MRPSLFCIILSSLLISFASACSGDGRVDAVLREADTLIFSAPDSAVSLLDSLYIKDASDEQRAHYALLLTKAREKAYIAVTDDSLINIAVEHYRGNGDSLEAQSLFYHGVILNHRGDYSEALISLTEAAACAAAIGDDFYLGMAAREQGEIYNMLREFDQAARFYHKAVEAFDRSGHPIHALSAQIYIPQSLALSGKVSEAYDSIRAIKVDNRFQSYPELLLDYYAAACNIAYINKEYHQSEDYYNSMLAGGRQPVSKLLSQMAKVKLHLNEPEVALMRGEMALKIAKDRDDTTAYQTFMSFYHRNINDFEKAYQYYFDAQNNNIPQINKLIAHPYTAKLNDYYYRSNNENKLKREAAERKNTIWMLIGAIILLSIGAIFTSIWIANRKNMQKREIETQLLLANIEKLRSDLAEAQKVAKNTTVELSPEINKIVPENNLANLPGGLLNSLCEARYMQRPGDEGYNLFGKRAGELLAELNHLDMYTDLENFVNYTSDGIMARFREQLPDLSDNHYKVAVLTFAGFSISSILIITQVKEKTYRNIRSTIRTGLSKSEGCYKDILLRFFVDSRYKTH